VSATEPVGAEIGLNWNVEVNPAEAREHLGSTPEPVTSLDQADRKKNAQLDLELKKRYAYSALIGMGAQLLIADGVLSATRLGCTGRYPRT